jgi:hypothetical protein
VLDFTTSGPKALVWVLDRGQLPPGRLVEVFDGRRSVWAIEPDGEPLADAVTAFAGAFEGKYTTGLRGWARVHEADGVIAEEMQFEFVGGPCWGEV